MGKNIVVAEDSSTTRKFIQVAVKLMGYTVHLAEDGQEALEKLGKVDADLLITDLNMPNMDGVELIKNVRASDKFKELPIIVLSSLSKEEDIGPAMEAGGSAYLQKPFERSAIQEEIKKFIG